MRTLQNRNESDSSGNIDIDDSYAQEDSGWNDSIELDLYVKNKDHDGKIKLQIIRKANAAVRLSSIIFKFKIDFDRIETPSGWTHKSRCPFPDHNDRGPSFGFNSKDDRFNCFGCGRGGGAVQFLAAIQNREQYDVAKELLASAGTESIIVDIEDKSSSRSDDMLLDFSKTIHKFLITHQASSKALEYVEKLTWNLDMYLDKHAMIGSIDADSLSARLEKLIERLNEFEAK